MAKRRAIPQSTVTDVLYASSRRCNYCFGLNQDLEIKEGQIAHLDRDPSNNDFNNLCWMCQEHHNAYDTKRSQTKNYHIAEAVKYRDELYALISRKREEAEKHMEIRTKPTSIATVQPERLTPFSIEILKVLNDPSAQLVGGLPYTMLLVQFRDKTKLDLHLDKLISLGYIAHRNSVIVLLQKAKMFLYGHTL